VEQIKIAYDLKPDDQIVREILDNMTYGMPGSVSKEDGSYISNLLTATPTIVPSSTPEIKPSSTPLPATATQEITPAPVALVLESPTPSETCTATAPKQLPETSTESRGDSSLPLCGSMILIPPLAGVVITFRKRNAQ